MEVLQFDEIEPGMKVLYKIKEDSHEFFTTSVISTSKGHPGIQMVRLQGGFELIYSADNFLKSDAISINIKTKDTKIFMYEEDKKVNIKSLN